MNCVVGRRICLSWIALIMLGCSQTQPESAPTAAARAYALSLLSEGRFQPPAGWHFETFRNADGALLRYGWAEPTGTRKGDIVFLPGYQTTAEELYETCHSLVAAGYAVWVLDRRGQGGSDRWLENPQKSYSAGFEHDANDVDRFARTIVQRNPREPLFLAGESLGGHIGFRVLHDQPALFNAAAFSSPSIAFHTGAFPEGLARVMTETADNLGFGGAYAIGEHDWQFNPNAGDANDPVKNDRDRALMEQAWFLKEPKLRAGGATNGYVASLFRSSKLEQSPGWLESIRTPVLIGQVVGDKIADAAVMSQACGRLVSCQLVAFTGTRHALFSDVDSTRSVWIDNLIGFFDARLAHASESK